MKMIALIPVALLAAGCAATADPNIAAPVASGSHHAEQKTAGQKPADGAHAVVYTVGGTARKGSITYMTPSGQEQRNGVKVPWHTKLRANDGTLLGVTAQNSGGGTITCEISVDGKLLKRGRSSGAYAVVTCDAMVGF